MIVCGMWARVQGSCTVEFGLLSQWGGSVYAIETEAEGVRLINENVAAYGLINVHAIAGKLLTPVWICQCQIAFLSVAAEGGWQIF